MATTRGLWCFYCDVKLGPRHERDHAPIPANAGGVETVEACIPCHHLKDRMLAGDWFLPAYVLACQDLAERTSVEFAEWPSDWDDMSRESRILWAKVAREVNRGMPNPLAGVDTGQGGQWHAATVRKLHLRNESAAADS